jgi:hypothetical protein
MNYRETMLQSRFCCDIQALLRNALIILLKRLRVMYRKNHSTQIGRKAV